MKNKNTKKKKKPKVKKVKIDLTHLEPFPSPIEAKWKTQAMFQGLGWMTNIVFKVKFLYREGSKILKSSAEWGWFPKDYIPTAHKDKIPGMKSGD